MAQNPTAIIDGLRHRSPDALAAFYDDCGGILYGLILRIVGNSGDAEVIFERIFREVWNSSYKQVRSDPELRAVTLLLGRKEAIQYRQGTADTAPHYDTHVCIGTQRIGKGVALNIVHSMNVAVNQLSVQDRELFDAVYFEGHSLSQIAALTGVAREELGHRIAAIFKVLRRATENSHDEKAHQPERSDRVAAIKSSVRESSSGVSQVPPRLTAVKPAIVSRNGSNRMPNGTS
jgi:DNA-directed RNA polymerase specialized sigma24 family protein